jgi:hypothetical protein
MCGIAGILGNPDRRAIKRMTDSIKRRGNDSNGLYENSPVVLGNRKHYRSLEWRLSAPLRVFSKIWMYTARFIIRI